MSSENPGGEDFSYDLAHDAEDVREPAQDVPEHVQQSTATPEETDGDYGYDEVHSLP